jgi:hypothetical protein
VTAAGCLQRCVAARQGWSCLPLLHFAPFPPSACTSSLQGLGQFPPQTRLSGHAGPDARADDHAPPKGGSSPV